MKKAIIVLAVVMMLLASCGNRKVFNTQYQYDHAIIYASDGAKVVEGEIEWWRDHSDATVDVKINGVVYLVHSINIIMSGGQKTF
jgi:uncharacterized lipoprotein NlpE involved in copper resistance